MKSLYFFNANRFIDIPKQPDIQAWWSIYNNDVINSGIGFCDRTNLIKIPLRIKVPLVCQLPSYDSNFNMTYEECCQNSARVLLSKQEKLGVPIKIMYSGGIDSTLILVSLIKEVGLDQIEKRVQVLMNNDSIEENPWMWERIIRPSNIPVFSSEAHQADWSTDRILVSGEGNDQLFGSDIYKDMQKWKGESILNSLWTEDLIYEYFTQRKKMPENYARIWTKVMSSSLRAAPCKVETMADWWWWINFSCKFQTVYYRIIMAAKNTGSITQNYMDDYFYQFFVTENHQRWSMIDRVHKHKGTQESYKYHAKELICDFLGSKEYMMKGKRGSLSRIMRGKKKISAIDENYRFIDNPLNVNDWYNEDNSFIE